jgi:putative ABC transport system permease protein
MSPREVLRIAVRGILANRTRSLLTMLGILIGVAAVIILVAVGNGSQIAVQKSIERLGSNTLTVLKGGGFALGGGGGTRNGTQSKSNDLTAKDVKALEDKSRAPAIKSVSPVVTAQSVTATYNGATHSVGSFIGTTPGYVAAGNYEIESGRAFDPSDYDGRAKVAVIGHTIAKDLGLTSPVGMRIQFNSASYEVIGVYKSKGSTGFQDSDDAVIAPLTAVEDSLTGNTDSYNSITVQAVNRSSMDAAQSQITSILYSTHDVTDPSNAGFQVLNQGSLLSTSSSTSHTLTVLLGAVAAISLLVGGIGVMNIMLVTVTERTREIGIRKAIGAKRADILSQFLVESVLLSLLGGVIGVAAGIVGSQFTIVGVHPVIRLYSIGLAFGVAVAVGLFFGLYPANRAAKLRPIEALRYE